MVGDEGGGVFEEVHVDVEAVGTTRARLLLFLLLLLLLFLLFLYLLFLVLFTRAERAFHYVTHLEVCGAEWK